MCFRSSWSNLYQRFTRFDPLLNRPNPQTETCIFMHWLVLYCCLSLTLVIFRVLFYCRFLLCKCLVLFVVSKISIQVKLLKKVQWHFSHHDNLIWRYSCLVLVIFELKEGLVIVVRKLFIWSMYFIFWSPFRQWSYFLSQKKWFDQYASWHFDVLVMLIKHKLNKNVNVLARM